MGNARTFRNACALAAIVGLTACNPVARQSDIDNLKADNELLRIRLATLEDRLSSAESEVADLEMAVSVNRANTDNVRNLGLENAGNTDRLRDVVNTNADISNREKLAEMTRRGACGTEEVPVFSDTEPQRVVGSRRRNIECTIDDLAPPKRR